MWKSLHSPENSGPKEACEENGGFPFEGSELKLWSKCD